MASNPLLDRAPAPTPKLLLTAREAAAALSVSEKTLWNHTAPRGPIPAVRFGGSVRYDVSDLRTFIDRAREGGVR